MKENYISRADTQHMREEEEQWAQIVASGSQYAGLILIYVQKLCTAGHEIEAAIAADLVDKELAGHYCVRLKTRVEKVLELLDQSEVEFAARSRLVDICTELETLSRSAEILLRLQELPEEIHQANHALCDELQRMVSA